MKELVIPIVAIVLTGLAFWAKHQERKNLHS